MDVNKPFYFEKTHEFDIGVKTVSNLDTLGFQDIYDTHYCPLKSYGIYQHDSVTNTFVEYTGSDVYWDANDLDFHYTTSTKGMNIYFIKALTWGDKAVDYEKIKITICGLETLTPASSSPIVYTYNFANTYSGLSIPWSTIQTWLTFDDNSG